MKKCPTCHSEFEAMLTYCPECGASYTEGTAPQEMPQQTDIPSSDKKIVLIGSAGDVKILPWGKSWTSLFFGPFVPLFRKDWTSALWLWGGWIGVVIIAVAILPESVMRAVGVSLSGAMWWNYNKLCAMNFIKKGYKPANEAEAEKFRSVGWFGVKS